MATTNKILESVLMRSFPNSFSHLQKIVMDCEKCTKNVGKKSIFGGDKFKSANEKLIARVQKTQQMLALDLSPERVNTAAKTLDEIDAALQLFKTTYPNWPAAYDFWDFWYLESKKLLAAS